MYAPSAGTKYSGRCREVAVSGGSTVLNKTKAKFCNKTTLIIVICTIYMLHMYHFQNRRNELD